MPYRPFGKAILDCLPKEGDAWVVPPKNADDPEWKGREDLRDLLICSIDPPGMPSFTVSYVVHDLYVRLGCQDIDDALHARPLSNGNTEAGVRKWSCRRVIEFIVDGSFRYCRCLSVRHV